MLEKWCRDACMCTLCVLVDQFVVLNKRRPRFLEMQVGWAGWISVGRSFLRLIYLFSWSTVSSPWLGWDDSCLALAFKPLDVWIHFCLLVCLFVYLFVTGSTYFGWFQRDVTRSLKINDFSHLYPQSIRTAQFSYKRLYSSAVGWSGHTSWWLVDWGLRYAGFLWHCPVAADFKSNTSTSR